MTTVTLTSSISQTGQNSLTLFLELKKIFLPTVQISFLCTDPDTGKLDHSKEETLVSFSFESSFLHF